MSSMSAPGISQAELVDVASEGGGPPVFEDFFEREHRGLFSALVLMARDRGEAEELMQDAFLRLWERWPRVSALDDPTGYLYRTAMNLYRSRRRRAATALRRVARPGERRDEIGEVEDREAVIRALRPLSRRQRAAVVLVDAIGLNSEEAGAALGVTASTVRVLLARGRATLRKEWTDHG
jgi:RNA polymerase sigma-70 factor (ECF subfamily)